MAVQNEFEQKLIEDFQRILGQFDKPGCVHLIKTALASNEINIVDLYTNVLAPSLNTIASNDKEQTISIWEEHVKSSIVRTVLENAYPYVLQQRAAMAPLPRAVKAMVVCLEEEYHEIGALMSSDFMTLLGFDVIFIGANTPKEDIFKALESVKPQVLCVSISNYYHLSKLHHLIDEIHANLAEKPLIAVGGYAIDHISQTQGFIKPDYYVHSYKDFEKIKEAFL